jgi:hypothetical protein
VSKYLTKKRRKKMMVKNAAELGRRDKEDAVTGIIHDMHNKTKTNNGEEFIVESERKKAMPKIGRIFAPSRTDVAECCHGSISS